MEVGIMMMDVYLTESLNIFSIAPRSLSMFNLEKVGKRLVAIGEASIVMRAVKFIAVT